MANAITSFLYSGQMTDVYGRQNLRARIYEMATGRFTQTDPNNSSAADPLSLHKYLFGNGDPANHYDPLGLMSTTELVFTAGIGAALGAIFTVATNYVTGQAQTWQSIALGALVGAVLAPLAVGIPAVGIGLGIGGFLTSGVTAYSVIRPRDTIT